MNVKNCWILTGLLLLAACRPKPIDIEVPQSTGAFSIASYCPNSHSIYVSATYSVSSMMRVLDTATLRELPQASKDVLMDSAIVSLQSPDGRLDTLRKLSPGIFSHNALHLLPGLQYTLRVIDRRTGKSATAATAYQPRPEVDTMYLYTQSQDADTSIRLHIRLKEVSRQAYYFVSYNSTRQARERTQPLPQSAQALRLFVPKQIALFTGSEVSGGSLEKDIALHVNARDTVIVQIGRADKAYYDYLAAYKRTGALINQLTGEPINLPTNIAGGYGYFALYHPVVALYNLNRL